MAAIREVEEEMERVSDATKASIDNYAQTAQAADEAKAAWKELDTRKARAKLEKDAGVEGAQALFDQLSSDTQAANKRKLALLKVANANQAKLDKALALLKLLLVDLTKHKTKVAEQA